MIQPKERRAFTREPLSRPCKVLRHETRKYAPATTRDLSSGGALLEIRSTRPVRVGERLGVGVAWSHSPIINADSMVEAKVVRVHPIDKDRQAVAVSFLEVLANTSAAVA